MAFQIDSLTFREMRDIETALGRPFSEAAEAGDIGLPAAIYWVALRRDDPAIEFDDVADIPLATIEKALALDTDAAAVPKGR